MKDRGGIIWSCYKIQEQRGNNGYLFCRQFKFLTREQLGYAFELCIVQSKKQMVRQH